MSTTLLQPQRGPLLRSQAPTRALRPVSAISCRPFAAPLQRQQRQQLAAAAPLRQQRQQQQQQQQQVLLPPPAASGSKEPAPAEQQPEGNDGTSVLSSLGLFLLWAGLAGYAFLLAPNQTPVRDMYFLEKLVGLGESDGVTLNTIIVQLFYIMGVWPLVYTALLVPSGKSGNGVPAWPFLTLSYAFGAFGLLPFMALWQPPKELPQVPAAKEDLEGVGNLMQKGMESPLVAFGCLAGAVACVGQAALADGAQWEAYFKLLEESRFINVMTIDFLTLTTLAPFWMYNDAALRKWDQRDSLLPVLSLVPVLGPIVYLCMRPRAQL